MIYKYVRMSAMILLFSVMPLAAAGAETQLDSVLGLPWGVSPEQAREIMASNGYSFAWKGTDAGTGSQVLTFKGPYAALPAYISLYFMNSRMWQLKARVSDEEYNMDYAFDTLNKLLTDKYGPKSANHFYNFYRNIPITVYTWTLDGNTKKIKLSKLATLYIDKTKMDGGASVTYENIQLFEALKNNI